jgi:hypothetical protein
MKAVMRLDKGVPEFYEGAFGSLPARSVAGRESQCYPGTHGQPGCSSCYYLN